MADDKPILEPRGMAEAEQGPEGSMSMSSGILRNSFPKRLSQVSQWSSSHGQSGHEMLVPGEKPPKPFDLEAFTRTSLTALVDSQQEFKDVLVQVCCKLEHLQRTLEMKHEKVRSSNSRYHCSTSSMGLTSTASHDLVKKAKSTKSESKNAAASTGSMSVDMFALNMRHNQQLLSKKKSFSVTNLAADQPRKGALKRMNSIAAEQRRSSQASVKVVAPESLENSLSLPGEALRLEEGEGDFEFMPRSMEDVQDSRSVETLKQQEEPGDLVSPQSSVRRESAQEELQASMVSVARSPYASVAADAEDPLTPVVCADIFAAKGPPLAARRQSNSLTVPNMSDIRQNHATTMPAGLSLNNEEVSNQQSSRSGVRTSPRPSTSDRKTLTSLDSLRAQHNVKVLAQQSERLKEVISEGVDDMEDAAYLEAQLPLDGRSMIGIVRFFLSITGVLDAAPGRVCKLLAHLSLVKTLVLSLLLLVMVGEDDDYRYVNFTTNAYTWGVVVTVLLLRWGRAEEDSLAVLLGPKEYQLDEYACKRGFIESSRLLGTLRAICLFGLWALMVASRILSGFFGQPETGLLPGSPAQDLVALGSYATAMLVTIAIFYVQLHVASGLELAVDMFSAHFFDSKDILAAMDEWNILQALIRCASCRIETSFMVLGASSLASLVLLATEVWTNPALLQDPLQAVFWLGWVYPPVLLLLYSLTRAAAVSEKCSRVAPFINSWDFPCEDEEEMESLHEGRQYIVQYIMQSEAGFYVKGVRLSNFTIMKLCYGFGALSFALLSQSMTAVLADAVSQRGDGPPPP